MDGALTRRPKSRPRTRRINLALQGGGAHGAFTWGVLDRLLEEPDIEIAGISGTSAGALNGAALKAGLVEAGPEGAKANLDWLWSQVGLVRDMRLADWMSALSPGPGMISQMAEHSLPFSIADAMTRVISPYAYGPFYRNPLDRVVRQFRFDEVCADQGPELFISATNVRTGKIRVFQGLEITTEVILASACLPTIFKAVEFIDPKTGEEEAFWDGGYSGNPALFPLFDKALPDDIVIVNINPLLREEVPKSPNDILNRLNEISFNSSLLRELRAINFVSRLLDEGALSEDRMKKVNVHMIADDALMNELSAATKLLPTPGVLSHLREAGRVAASEFLEAHGDALNKHSSVDLPEMFS